jgi:hypothetical protein
LLILDEFDFFSERFNTGKH